jgi:hypothetical protein
MRFSRPQLSVAVLALILQTVCGAEQKESPNVTKETLGLLQGDLLKAAGDDQSIVKISRDILNKGKRLLASEMNPSKAPEIGSLKKAGTKLTPDQDYYVYFWLLRAYAAINADDATAGRQAATVLKNLGLEDTQVPKEKLMMASLDKKGWLYNDSTNPDESSQTTPIKDNPLPEKIKRILGTHQVQLVEPGWPASVDGDGKLVFAVLDNGKTVIVTGYSSEHIKKPAYRGFPAENRQFTSKFSGSFPVKTVLLELEAGGLRGSGEGLQVGPEGDPPWVGLRVNGTFTRNEYDEGYHSSVSKAMLVFDSVECDCWSVVWEDNKKYQFSAFFEK